MSDHDLWRTFDDARAFGNQDVMESASKEMSIRDEFRFPIVKRVDGTISLTVFRNTSELSLTVADARLLISRLQEAISDPA
jgi:hypothetical protein